MPQVSRIAKLPIKLRREVNERLLSNGFSDYEALAAELRSRGYRISKSALHKHGQRLKKLARETEQDAFTNMVRGVPDNALPMTLIILFDLQTSAARVMSTLNSIAEIETLLEPLHGVAAGSDNKTFNTQEESHKHP